MPRRRTPRTVEPPRAARWLLNALLRGEAREVVAGDLEEEFRAVCAQRGRLCARLWYWRHALASIAAVRAPRASALEAETSQRKGDAMSHFLQDLRYGLRNLRKNPGFAAVAVLTLALGIGANTAMFSIVYGVLLKPLPYANPDRLVLVHKDNPRRVSPNGTHWVSTGDVQDWREQNAVFESIAGYADGRQLEFYVEGSDTPETVTGAMVTGNLFDTLGVPLLLGRTFLPEEHEFRSGTSRAIILSYDLWQRRFGGDPGMVGKSVQASFVGSTPRPYMVVGITPPGFQFPPRGEFWTPQLSAGSQFTYRTYIQQPIARLKPGVTMEQAAESMRILGGQLDQARSAEDAYPVMVVGFLDHIVRDVKRALWVFTAGVGFVLLIACANVSNLVLARGTTRAHDLAIRTALGASRLRIVRHLLAENLLLAGCGMVAGVLLAYGGIRAFLALAPGGLPRAFEIHLGWPVWMFAAGVAAVSALLFGLWPAWTSSRVQLSAALAGCAHSGARSERLSGRQLRNVLVFAESALAMVLMVGAGLMLNSFLRLTFVDPGFDPRNLLAVDLAGRAAAVAFADSTPGELSAQKRLDALERLQGMAGVEAAAYTSTLPPGGAPIQKGFHIVGQPVNDLEAPPEALVLGASHGYFRTMRVPVLAGREFSAADIGQPVVMVNQALARVHLAGADAVGQQLLIAGEVRTIVGVAGDVRQSGLDRAPAPIIYWPTVAGYRTADQTMIAGGTRVVVRTQGEPLLLAESVRGLLENERLSNIRPSVSLVADDLWTSVARPRFWTFVVGVFGVVGLALAAFGIYGTVAFGVSQRTHEIGVRMALGATPHGILRMTLTHGIVPVLVGIGVGALGAWSLAHYLGSLLFDLPPTDVLTYAATAALLVLASALACWIPARRAARVDPLVALRYE